MPHTLRTLPHPVTVLAWTLFCIPALGVPSVLVVQDTFKAAIAAFGIVLATLLWAHQRCRTSQPPITWHTRVLLPLTLAAYAAGSTLWGHTYLATVEAIRWGLLALLLWLLLQTVHRGNVQRLLWGLHAGLCVAALWVLGQFWFGWTLFPQVATPASTFVNRNFFAEYGVAVLPFSIWLLLQTRATRRIWAIAASVGLCGLALLMTGTRSALLTLLLGAPVLAVVVWRWRTQWAAYHWPARYRWAVAALIATLIGGLGTLPQHNSATSALGHSSTRAISVTQDQEYLSGSFAIRTRMWQASSRMLAEHPWTGVGAGGWEVHIPRYQDPGTIAEMDYYAHNEWLHLVSEYGLPLGLAWLLALLGYAACQVYRCGRAAADDADASLRAVALCSLGALLLVGSVGFPLHLTACGVLLMLILAMLQLPDAPHATTHAAPSSSPAPRLLRIAAACGLLLVCAASVQAMRAEAALMRAQMAAAELARKPPPSPERQAALRATVQQQLAIGRAINPHYRKFIGNLGDLLAASGQWDLATHAWQTVADSRPHIKSIWAELTRAYLRLQRWDEAAAALQQLQRLRPDALETGTLRIALLDLRGDTGQATDLLQQAIGQGAFDEERLMTGYALAYRSANWPLAIQTLRLRSQHYPAQAVDSYYRLGTVYAHPAVQQKGLATEAFAQGLRALPPDQHAHYLQQVPPAYREAVRRYGQRP